MVDMTHAELLRCRFMLSDINDALGTLLACTLSRCMQFTQGPGSTVLILHVLDSQKAHGDGMPAPGACVRTLDMFASTFWMQRD